MTVPLALLQEVTLMLLLDWNLSAARWWAAAFIPSSPSLIDRQTRLKVTSYPETLREIPVLLKHSWNSHFILVCVENIWALSSTKYSHDSTAWRPSAAVSRTCLSSSASLIVLEEFWSVLLDSFTSVHRCFWIYSCLHSSLKVPPQQVEVDFD